MQPSNAHLHARVLSTVPQHEPDYGAHAAGRCLPHLHTGHDGPLVVVSLCPLASGRIVGSPRCRRG